MKTKIGLVGTLKQGYPLLQCEGTVPMRLSLVAWRTTPDPTTWTDPGLPRGQRRQYPPRYQRWVRTPIGKCRTPAYTDRTSRQGPGPPRVQTGPPGRVPNLSVWGPGHSQQGPALSHGGLDPPLIPWRILSSLATWRPWSRPRGGVRCCSPRE